VKAIAGKRTAAFSIIVGQMRDAERQATSSTREQAGEAISAWWIEAMGLPWPDC
jgi:hypothetical protein